MNGQEVAEREGSARQSGERADVARHEEWAHLAVVMVSEAVALVERAQAGSVMITVQPKMPPPKVGGVPCSPVEQCATHRAASISRIRATSAGVATRM